MTEDAVELLQRQCEFLLRQETAADFFVQVDPFLRALSDEPRLAVHMDDVLSEAVDVLNVLEAVDDQLLPELVTLREELAQLQPRSDDSRMSRPAPRTGDFVGYQSSLAYFDEVAAAPAPTPAPDGSATRAGTLISILQGKVTAMQWEAEHASGTEPEAVDPPAESAMDDWNRRLGNVTGRHTEAVRTTLLKSMTSAGYGYARLRLVPEALNPHFDEVPADQPPIVRAEQLFRYATSAEYVLAKVIGGRLNEADRSFVNDRVAELRRDVERLQEELWRRLGTTRSRLALVDRFKQRAEWHDRERLAAVATDDSLPGGPEDRLTAEFARYLFDQGLSPLTKPMTGGLQPDLLDASVRPTFYVEAKQYGSESHARRDVVGAVKQVFDTVGRLQGTPYAVVEAFCVVFRRAGPRYVLPDWVRGERYRLYLRLVDIASPAESGRRQRHAPVVLTEEDFLADRVQAGADSGM